MIAATDSILPLLAKHGFAPKVTTLRVNYRTLHPAQLQIKSEMRRFNVASLGRRFGKTFMCVDWLVEPAVNGSWYRDGMQKTKSDLERDGIRVAWFAPTNKMWKEVWGDVMKVIGVHNIRKSNIQDGRIELINGSKIDFWSLEAIKTMRGRFYARIVVDEAAHIALLEDAWEKVIRPTLADLIGEAFFISTPNGFNFFRTLYEYGEDKLRPDWNCWMMPTTANPYINPKEIEESRETMSEDSFRQEHLGEFLRGGGKVFRNIEANLKSLEFQGVKIKEHTPEMHEGHRLVAGVDWAQVQDFTGISVGCETCKCEVHIERFNKIEFSHQRMIILSILQKWNVSEAHIEENSIGRPNFEELAASGLVTDNGTKTKFIAVKMTSESKPRLVQSLVLSLEKVLFQFLPDKVAANELMAYEAKVNVETGNIRYSAPNGGNDDTVVMRMMMLNAVKRPSSFRIIGFKLR